MASMDDDSFRVRVEKIFGSLAPSNSNTWSLSDDAVERREWRRDKDTSSARDETPCSSSFDEFLRKDRRRNFRLDDDGDDDGDERVRDRDEWEIRSSIGLDSTLDNEEEEDEFDKVAAGRENAGERMYLNDVTERGRYLNLHNVVPNALNAATKDPRANHHAARIRLKEDEDETEARSFSFPHSDCDTEVKNFHAKVSEESGPPKSILKRKDKSADFKPQKRVRFDPACKIDCVTASERTRYSSVNTSSVDDNDSNDGFQPPQNACRVPDYLVNPSKYTHYSFDSSDEFNEESSIKACMDVLRLAKDLKAKEVEPVEEIASGDLPKAVTFIPKKKVDDLKAEKSSSEINENKEDDGKLSSSRLGFPVGIAVAESQHCEASAEEEIEPETNVTDDGVRFQKPGRKYRTPSRSDDSDS